MTDLPTRLSAQLRSCGLDPAAVLRVIHAGLAEDLADGPDVTTQATIPPGSAGTADVAARRPGVAAGLYVADAVFHIATLTRQWVDIVAGTGAKIRDTRKTLPGLRALEKYAVRCGGGANHRMSLSDAALIKDNHVASAGSVTAAFDAVGKLAPDLPVEVECDTLEQVDEAVAAGAGLILLDNFSVADMAEAVRRTAGLARLEASGGLRLEDAAAVAATGVDYLAVGALTHSAPVLDIGLDLVPAGRGGSPDRSGIGHAAHD